MNRKNKAFREVRKRYTKRATDNSVWLVIDHQSFQLQDYGVDEGEDPRKIAEWRRDQLAFALERFINA